MAVAVAGVERSESPESYDCGLAGQSFASVPVDHSHSEMDRPLLRGHLSSRNRRGSGRIAAGAGCRFYTSLPLSRRWCIPPACSGESVQSVAMAADPRNTMWCKQCGQDVPGVVPPERREYVCPRCSSALGDGPSHCQSTSSPEGAAVASSISQGPADGLHDAPLGDYDSWELDEQLRHMDRVLGGANERGTRPLGGTRRITRIDAAHAQQLARHGPASGSSGTALNRQSQASEAGLPGFVWASLLLGLMGFACGVALLGWSIIVAREDLWRIGVPVALGGQLCLLLGLILQLDRLSNDHRRTTTRLRRLDGQMHELKTTARMPGAVHTSSSGAVRVAGKQRRSPSDE